MLDIPSPFSALCLEPTTLTCFPYEVFEETCFSEPFLIKKVFEFTQWLGVMKELREQQLLCLSAQESYTEFMHAYPELATRLTQTDIAHYLGITPIALSRIKNRLTPGNKIPAVKP